MRQERHKVEHICRECAEEKKEGKKGAGAARESIYISGHRYVEGVAGHGERTSSSLLLSFHSSRSILSGSPPGEPMW